MDILRPPASPFPHVYGVLLNKTENDFLSAQPFIGVRFLGSSQYLVHIYMSGTIYYLYITKCEKHIGLRGAALNSYFKQKVMLI
jgi:hypothetical protein